MECKEHIKDLLPDYYLGQLPPEEAEEVRQHLTEHAACREALEEVAQVLDLLPFAVNTTEPPPKLKEQVMTKIFSEPRQAEEAPASNIPDTLHTGQDSDSGRRNLLPLMAAAAVLAAFVGLTWAYVDLSQENRQLQAEVQELQESVEPQQGLLAVTARGAGPAQDARGTAVVDPGTGALALDVYNLPDPPTDHAYKAWLVTSSGEALSLGPMEVGDQGYGQMTGEVSEPLDRYDYLQLSVEPIGSESMSGPVYLEASL